jgi:cobyrinic acid a,c-diamide synthase
MPDKPQFLIAAPSSDSGKTTVTLGLLRLLANKGLNVQPFKCGPDYIDPILHEKAAGNISINMDTYMASNGHVKGIYHKYLQKSDVAIVEGVMGLFDGADKMQGSSAEIALLLDLPVILVINAKAMAYSAAALIYGLKNFHSGIKIAGVIFNNVNTPSHYVFLQDACKDAGVEALGYLPTQPDIKIPSRHLGLSIAANIDFNEVCNKIAHSIAETVAIERLLQLTNCPYTEQAEETAPKNNTNRKIAVAADEAFRFTYHENLEVLKQFGEVVFFSPLADALLPECDLLYLAGGYPELFLAQLSQNKSMLSSISAYCNNNGKTYAECGGMMYLGKYIADRDGKQFEMANFLPIATSMEKPALHLGYRSVFIGELNIKGHEFHYSTCIELGDADKLNCRIFNAKGIALSPNIYQKNRTVASYNHLYWGEQRAFIEKLLQDDFYNR